MTSAIRIVHLYPREMNIYGDHGNILTLSKRLQWHGYQAEVVEVHRGDDLPPGTDLVVGGGGQNSGQTLVEGDLHRLRPQLADMVEDGTPMLLVCGLYQLFGHRFVTGDGRVLHGIGLLDIDTIAGPKRLIGNVEAESDDFGAIIGYENHGGLTTLGSQAAPLGRVPPGMGNNGSDGTEGARYKNIIGTYLHGSLLPKNPAIADHVIASAAERRYGAAHLSRLDDTLTDEARRVARGRPR